MKVLARVQHIAKKNQGGSGNNTQVNGYNLPGIYYIYTTQKS